MRGAETIQVDMSRQAANIKTKDNSVYIIKQEPMETPQEFPIEPDSVDWHEAAHITVGLARGVIIKYASSIATAEFEGVTIPDRYDGPTAAAGGVDTEGDGHDTMVILLNGDNPDSARSIAKSTLKSKTKAYRKLAEGLKMNGILHSHEINWIYKNAEKEDENDTKETMYEVIVKAKDGKEEREIVVLPEDQTILNVSLPQSGDIFVANEKEL